MCANQQLPLKMEHFVHYYWSLSQEQQWMNSRKKYKILNLINITSGLNQNNHNRVLKNQNLKSVLIQKYFSKYKSKKRKLNQPYLTTLILFLSVQLLSIFSGQCIVKNCIILYLTEQRKNMTTYSLSFQLLSHARPQLYEKCRDDTNVPGSPLSPMLK